MSSVFESLESRQFLSASIKHLHYKAPHHTSLPRAKTGYELAKPYGSASPSSGSYTPSQLRTAYGFNNLSLPSTSGDGAGQTIAIIDAYDDPAFVNTGTSNFNNSDLHKFDLAFGLQDPPSFTKVNQAGGSSLPAQDTGWDGEIALDVEWAHAIAPKANLVLVEANSSNTSDLILSAENYARNRSDVSVVSMSFGLTEYSGESQFDSYFQTPSGHQGITFVASTGDNGSPGGYPAFSPNVVAVGGTSLTLDRTTGAYIGETGWGHGSSSSTQGGTGGGISRYESQPSYQGGVVTQSSTRRTTPDLSYVADPYTGVAVYDSVNGGSAAPWIQVGGTSLSSPLFAATVAIADQARVANGLGTLDGKSQTLPKIYSMPQTDFHDVTSGSNGSYSAGVGYDLVTGRGTPVANTFLNDLAGVPAATTVLTPSAPDLATASDSGASNTDNLTNVATPTFTGAATPGSAITLFAGSAQVGATTADTSGNYTVTSSPLSDGTYNLTVKSTLGVVSSASSGSSITIDTTAPTATAPTFAYQTSQSLAYTFSEALMTDPAPSDLSLVNVNTGAAISTAATYDANTRTVTYTFPAGVLDNGVYQPTLLAAGIKDLAGNSMASDAVGSFGFLQGDANGNGIVDSADFTAMSANFGKTGATFADGDFNYDHVVNAIDFGILSSSFGKSVSATPQQTNASDTVTESAAVAAPSANLFSSSRISKTDAAISVI